MNLYLLQAYEIDGYDCYAGFIIRAKSPAAARKEAQDNGADEIRGEWSVDDKAPKSMPYWTDPKKTSCQLLSTKGLPGIVLSDFNAG